MEKIEDQIREFWGINKHLDESDMNREIQPLIHEFIGCYGCDEQDVFFDHDTGEILIIQK